MKLIKMLGITMALAMIAMAFIGTGTAASAARECWKKPVVQGGTLLCPRDINENSTALQWAFQRDLFIASTVFKSASGSITCKEAALEVATEVSGSETLGEATELVFKGCTDTLPVCTVSETIEASPHPVEHIYKSVEPPEGEFVLVEPKITVKMGICGTCVYGSNASEKIKGNWYNGATEEETSEIKFTEAPVKKVSGVESCPKEVAMTTALKQFVLIGQTQLPNEKIEVSETFVWLAEAQK